MNQNNPFMFLTTAVLLLIVLGDAPLWLLALPLAVQAFLAAIVATAKELQRRQQWRQIQQSLLDLEESDKGVTQTHVEDDDPEKESDEAR